MKTEPPLKTPIFESIGTIRHFVAETTGQAPTDEEIADALKRYFVLNEIKAHILMLRGDE